VAKNRGEEGGAEGIPVKNPTSSSSSRRREEHNDFFIFIKDVFVASRPLFLPQVNRTASSFCYTRFCRILQQVKTVQKIATVCLERDQKVTARRV
jgi:hypothetical protein